MPYTIPAPFGTDVPFTQMHVWQWARTVPRADVDVFNYLDSLGFVIGQDKCTEQEFEILKYACDAFHRTAPHIAECLTFSECFTEASTPGAFWVQGKPGRYHPRPAILEALQGAGWIYDITPETTYFAVINGRLFAKYQQIIGSRCIVQLREGA